MTKPTLSVYMTNYNHGNLLPRAINAIIQQSNPPDEFIIVDDHSTDNSVEIIKDFASRYNYIKLIQNSQQLGVTKNLEILLPLTTSDYIYGAAADDFVLPGFFRAAMDMAKNFPFTGVVFGQMSVVDERENEIYLGTVKKWKKSGYYTPEQFLNECLESEPPTHSLSGATICKRENMKAVGWYRSELGSWCDTFAIRAIGLKTGVCYLSQKCASWTLLPQSFSQTDAKNISAQFKIIRHAEQLMRSSDFCNIFPAKHVARWALGYRMFITLRAIANLVGFRSRGPIANTNKISHRFLIKTFSFIQNGTTLPRRFWNNIFSKITRKSSI